MEPLIARAFLSLILSEDQKIRLIDIENNLPPGHYLQGFEICQLFALKLEPLDPFREQQMLIILEEWRRKNWLDSKIQEKDHEKICFATPRHFVNDGKYGWCQCRTYQQDIHDLMKYVSEKWIEPLPILNGKVSAVFND